jgi:bacteriorhodopsin
MIVETAYFSLLVQIITGFIEVYGLKIEVPKDIEKFKDLLKIELGVQTIELIFYIWLVFNIKKKTNITKYRYYDWFISTPLMLFTLMVYYDKKSKTVQDFIVNNKKEITQVLTLNALMLLFGLLGELNKINYQLGGILGFIPFILMFKIIYQKYVKDQKEKSIFYYFVFFWGLYGVAYFQNYELKNSMYNILDLFAKNGFGLWLVWILYQKKISKKEKILS